MDALTKKQMQYLQALKYWKKRGEIPKWDLKGRYGITSEDVAQIKALLGKQKTAKVPGQSFPSATFKKDSRVKAGLSTEASLPPNRGMFMPSSGGAFYEEARGKAEDILDSRDFTEPPEHPSYYPSSLSPYETSSTAYASAPLETEERLREVYQKGDRRPRRSDRTNEYLIDYCLAPPNPSQARMERYEAHSSKPMSRETQMDFTDKTVRPTLPQNPKKEINTSFYRGIPFMGPGSGMRDAGIETDLRYGLSSRLADGRGDGNPHDHYFQFVGEDVQDPEHVVMPFPRGGENTRLQNKSHARPMQRAIF